MYECNVVDDDDNFFLKHSNTLLLGSRLCGNVWNNNKGNRV